jgi:hypothetical protein
MLCWKSLILTKTAFDYICLAKPRIGVLSIMGRNAQSISMMRWFSDARVPQVMAKDPPDRDCLKAMSELVPRATLTRRKGVRDVNPWTSAENNIESIANKGVEKWPILPASRRGAD